MTSDLDDGLTGAEAPPATADEGGADEPHFPNVYVFVSDFLCKVYARPVNKQSSWRWCSQWWDHPEAVSRLEALWRAFEALRLDPGTGGGVWWRDFADPTMAALSHSEGTFAACSDASHQVPPGLPVLPPATWLLES